MGRAAKGVKGTMAERAVARRRDGVVTAKEVMVRRVMLMARKKHEVVTAKRAMAGRVMARADGVGMKARRALWGGTRGRGGRVGDPVGGRVG